MDVNKNNTNVEGKCIGHNMWINNVKVCKSMIKNKHTYMNCFLLLYIAPLFFFLIFAQMLCFFFILQSNFFFLAHKSLGIKDRMNVE